MAGERMGNDPLPPKPDDALADSTEPHGPCPRCGRLNNFTFKGSAPLIFDGSSYSANQDSTLKRIHVERRAPIFHRMASLGRGADRTSRWGDLGIWV